MGPRPLVVVRGGVQENPILQSLQQWRHLVVLRCHQFLKEACLLQRGIKVHQKSPVKQTLEKPKIPSSPKAKMSSPRSSDKSPSPVVKEKSEKATKKIEEEKSTSPLKDK